MEALVKHLESSTGSDHLETLKKLNPLYFSKNNAFCNKCGYFGTVDECGGHRTPEGDTCSYTTFPREPITEWTSHSKQLYLDTVAMMVKATMPHGIDPNILINQMRSFMRYDLVIDLMQTALERGKIDFNLDGFVIVSGD